MSDEKRTLLDPQTSFASLAQLIDSRLLRALADMGYARPTLVQARAIPLALEGRDVLARARIAAERLQRRTLVFQKP